jgi:hypothetical protein
MSKVRKLSRFTQIDGGVRSREDVAFIPVPTVLWVYGAEANNNLTPTVRVQTNTTPAFDITWVNPNPLPPQSRPSFPLPHSHSEPTLIAFFYS